MGYLLCEALTVARERLQGLHLVGRQPRRVIFAHAQRLCDEEAVDAAVLHTRETLQLAHGPHVDGVDHDDRVAGGGEVREAGHPVMARCLHGDRDIFRAFGHSFEPCYAPLEAALAVPELQGAASLPARVCIASKSIR